MNLTPTRPEPLSAGQAGRGRRYEPPLYAAVRGIDPQTRQRIKDAVLEIFSQREFHRIGLIEVARGAKVSLQTLYKYYGSKEVLLFSCLDHWLSQLAQRMIDHLQGIEDYKERLRKVFWVCLDFFERNPRVVQLVASSVYLNTWRHTEGFQHPELFATFLRVLGEGRARGILTDAVDEKLLLDYFLGVLTRLVLMQVQRGSTESLAERSNLLFEMLWRAIARPS